MKKCFVVSPIGQENSPMRKKADEFLAALEEIDELASEFQIIRADKITDPGNVTNQAIKYVATSELVIINLFSHNPNVYYEMAVRHCNAKPCITTIDKDGIKESEKWYFNVQQERVISYDLSTEETKHEFQRKIIKILKKINLEVSTKDNPVQSAYNSYPSLTWDFLQPKTKSTNLYEFLDEKFYVANKNIENIIEQINHIVPAAIDKIYERGKAEYIRGEDEAFAALTECTNKATQTVRSTRFSPWSVINQTNYMNSILSCVRDPNKKNKPRVTEYHRIICTNNKDKINDVVSVVVNAVKTPLTFYLTSQDNNFEIVVIDNTDAFLHFYNDERIIVSTLHVQGSQLVKEFERIFDRLISDNEDKIVKIDCAQIDYDNIKVALDKINEAFRDSPCSEEVRKRFEDRKPKLTYEDV